MPGTVLENLSGRKLSVLVTILLLSQLACFLVGLISPSPASSQPILATVCVDKNPAADSMDRWFNRRCPHSIELTNDAATAQLKSNNLVSITFICKWYYRTIMGLFVPGTGYSKDNGVPQILLFILKFQYFFSFKVVCIYIFMRKFKSRDR